MHAGSPAPGRGLSVWPAKGRQPKRDKSMAAPGADLPAWRHVMLLQPGVRMLYRPMLSRFPGDAPDDEIKIYCYHCMSLTPPGKHAAGHDQAGVRAGAASVPSKRPAHAAARDAFRVRRTELNRAACWQERDAQYRRPDYRRYGRFAVARQVFGPDLRWISDRRRPRPAWRAGSPAPAGRRRSPGFEDMGPAGEAARHQGRPPACSRGQQRRCEVSAGRMRSRPRQQPAGL